MHPDRSRDCRRENDACTDKKSSGQGDPRVKSFSKKKERKKERDRKRSEGVKDPFVRGRALVASVPNHSMESTSVLLFFPPPPLHFHPAFLSSPFASSSATECRKRDGHNRSVSRRNISTIKFEVRILRMRDR